MSFEIEHKYLVANSAYKELATSSSHIVQGYLSRVPERTVRVRVRDDRGYLTVKGLTRGDTRLEFEYEIPLADAKAMLDMCEKPLLEKTRYIVPFGGYKWEVDIYESCPSTGKPLAVAEIELPESDTSYPLPPFVGENVTSDPRYYNSNL